MKRKNIILTGYIASEAALLMYNEPELRGAIAGRFAPQYIKKVETFCEFTDSAKSWNIINRCMQEDDFAIELGDGGIFAGLWEMSKQLKMGFKVPLTGIPTRQETTELCELFDLSPYELPSKGCMLFTADEGQALVYELKQEGIPAQIIGHLTKEKAMHILGGEEPMCLNRPVYGALNKLITH